MKARWTETARMRSLALAPTFRIYLKIVFFFLSHTEINQHVAVYVCEEHFAINTIFKWY